MDAFSNWMETLPRPMFPQDFLWFDEERGGFVWYLMYHDGLVVPEAYELVDFPGGLYAVACGVDGESNEEAMDAIRQFLREKSSFVEDPTRKQLGNVITPPAAEKALGYLQMDYYVPIKAL